MNDTVELIIILIAVIILLISMIGGIVSFIYLLFNGGTYNELVLTAILVSVSGGRLLSESNSNNSFSD